MILKGDEIKVYPQPRYSRPLSKPRLSAPDSAQASLAPRGCFDNLIPRSLRLCSGFQTRLQSLEAESKAEDVFSKRAINRQSAVSIPLVTLTPVNKVGAKLV